MPGNIANFNRYDVLRCFLHVEDKKSRQALVDEIGVGEGSVRTILDILKEKKLIESTRQGHSYTNNGKKILGIIRKEMQVSKEEPKMGIFLSLKKFAVLYSNSKKKEMTIKERDTGVKNGAEIVLFFNFKNSRLAMPTDEDSGYKFESLEKLFSFKEGDILLITMANDKRSAENSCFAILYEFSEGIGKIIESIGE